MKRSFILKCIPTIWQVTQSGACRYSFRRDKMDRQKIWKIMKKIFFLPLVPTLLIAVPSFFLVFYVLAKGTAYPAVSYLSYLHPTGRTLLYETIFRAKIAFQS